VADLKREKEADWEEASSAQFRSVKYLLRKKLPACQSQTVIRVYDEAGNVIETREHRGDYSSALRS